MNESRASRYHRHRRWAEGLAVSVRLLLLFGIITSGLSTALGHRALAAVVGLPIPGVLLGALATAGFGLILSVVSDVVVLPFSWYSTFLLERRYRAVRAGISAWLGGYARVMMLHAGLWMGAGLGVHLIMARWPDVWWLIAGGVFGFLTLALSHVGPVVVLPRLYQVRPLDRPALRARLDALTRSAGAPGLAVHEWELGLETPPRAALVGLGSTRRVLLSDSLLSDYSDDEIEVVVAHELAHHLNHDTWWTFAFELSAAVMVCGVAHLALTWMGPTYVAGRVRVDLPLLALVVGVMTMALAPVGNHLSRRLERRADQDALEMTNRPDALVSGLRRLAEQNLAEERPSRVVQWLFYTHPPLADRLEAARGTADH